MSQQSFSDTEYSLRKRTTKRKEFLDIKNEIIPWDAWIDLIKPQHFSGKCGRPSKGIEKMLRMYRLNAGSLFRRRGVKTPCAYQKPEDYRIHLPIQ